MNALSNRVRRLEERFGPAIERMRQAEIPAGPPAVEVITELLARAGVEQGPNESLAETTRAGDGLEHEGTTPGVGKACGVMKAMGHRVRRLEKQFAVPTGPRERWRVVLSAVHRAANLANSRCTRTLNSFGLLTEIVELDGRRDSVTDEELERFIESFPVEQADDRRSPG